MWWRRKDSLRGPHERHRGVTMNRNTVTTYGTVGFLTLTAL